MLMIQFLFFSISTVSKTKIMGAFLHSRGSFWRQNDKKTRFSFYKEMREKKSVELQFNLHNREIRS